MALKFKLHDGLIEMTISGDMSAKDFLESAKLMQDAEAELEVTPDRITDLSAANLAALETEDVRAFAQLRNRAVLKNKVKSAIVAPKLDQFGLARLFQTHNKNPALDVQVFRDLPSAYEWLGRKRKAK